MADGGSGGAGPAARTPRGLARRLGWVALAVAIAATTLLVPPLIAPGRPHDAPAVAASPLPPAQATSSPSPAASPTTATSSPTRSAARPGSHSSASPSPPSPAPISVHAADPANLRVGARIIECPTCDGGSRVGYIGGPNTLAIPVTVAQAGRRTLTVVYETEGQRTLKVAVNDGATYTLILAGADSWLIPAQTTLSVDLPAGTNWIRFFNDEASAPDINRIVVS